MLLLGNLQLHHLTEEFRKISPFFVATCKQHRQNQSPDIHPDGNDNGKLARDESNEC